MAFLGGYVDIKTGKLDANARVEGGQYPFFTCSRKTLQIDKYAFDADAVLVAGNGDLNVKYFKGKFNAYQRTYAIVVNKPEALDTRYLYHWLSEYVGRLRELSIGGVIKYIKLGMLTGAEIPLPPLEEQKRIAAILDKADALRRKRQQAIDLTDQLLRSVFLDMFGDPVTNPKGWNVIKGDEIFKSLRYGTSQKCVGTKISGSYPVLRIPNIVKEKIDYSDLKYAVLKKKESDKLLLNKGDILFVRTNGNPANIGRCAVFDDDIDALYASYLIKGEVGEEYFSSSEFIRFIISFPTYRSKVVREAKTTAGNYNISTQGLRNLEFYVPPMDDQNRYLEFAKKMTEKQFQLNRSSDLSENLVQALTQQAFQGELTKQTDAA